MKGYNMMSIKGNSKSYIEILSTYGALAETISGTFDFEIEDKLTYWHCDHGTWDDECQYTAVRNIQYHTGLGYYDYHPTSSVQPHAVKDVENTSGRVSWDSHDLTFNNLGKVSYISSHENGSYGIVYDPDDVRWESLLYNSSQWPDTVRRYVGDMEIVSSGPSEVCRFYYLGHGVILRKVNNAVTPLYAFTDNLGSVTRLYTETGVEKFRAQYDPWGVQEVKRNDVNFARGYCGHEMLNDFQLINMNGRMYDPILGRFLSPDNYVQLPTSAQSFNRYSYCLNNPLKYVDPDGELWWLFPVVAGIYFGGSSANGTFNPFKWDYGNWKTYAGMAVGGIAGYAGATIGGSAAASALVGGASTFETGIVGGMMGGMVSGGINGIGMTAVMGGSLGDMMQGMVKGSVMGGIGGALSGGINAAIGDFLGVEGCSLKNGLYELGHSALKGAATGLAGGAMMAAMEQDVSYLWKGALSGAAFNVGMAGIRIGILGTTFIPNPNIQEGIKDYGQLYRRGSFLMGRGTGVTLGNQIVVRLDKYDQDYNRYLLQHEFAHILQIQEKGMYPFYSKIIGEFFQYGWKNIYSTHGTFEYNADKYAFNRLGFYYDYHGKIHYSFP